MADQERRGHPVPPTPLVVGDEMGDTRFVVGQPPVFVIADRDAPDGGADHQAQILSRRQLFQLLLNQASHLADPGPITSADLENLGHTEFYSAVVPGMPRREFLQVLGVLGLLAGFYSWWQSLQRTAQMLPSGDAGPNINVFPVTPQEVTLESIPATDPFPPELIRRLIPPAFLKIFLLQGPGGATENPLNGAHVFVDTRSRLTVGDLILLTRSWFDVVNNHPLPRTIISYRGANIEYTLAGALKKAIEQLPRVNGSDQRQVDHPKGARVITPDDAALLVSAGCDVARRTIDTLTTHGVDVRGLTFQSIGSVADGNPQLNTAEKKVSDIDQALVLTDPKLFLQIKTVLDDTLVSTEMEGQIAKVFTDKNILVPYGNHLVLILLDSSRRIADITDVALGLLNPDK